MKMPRLRYQRSEMMSYIKNRNNVYPFCSVALLTDIKDLLLIINDAKQSELIKSHLTCENGKLKMPKENGCCGRSIRGRYIHTLPLATLNRLKLQ